MAWFDELCPHLLRMRPEPDHEFITQSGSHFAVIVHNDSIVGYCSIVDVWVSRIRSTQGRDALEELLHRRARVVPSGAARQP